MIEQAEAARSAKPKVRELRQGIRKKSLLPATLVTESGSTDCHVLDLSRGGARVSSPVAVVEEQAVTLIVKPIGTFAGLVAWRGDGGFGVKFLAQHGMASPPPASVEAAVADAIETPIPADEGEGEGDAAALLRKVERAHADEPASEPRPAKRSRKPRPEPKQPALELRDGDIICLLRRKDPADEAAATGASDAPRRRMKDLTEFELVQLDGKHFMTLLEQRAAYSIELMRVASGAEDHSEAEQAREVVEPKAAPEDHSAGARARKRAPTAAA